MHVQQNFSKQDSQPSILNLKPSANYPLPGSTDYARTLLPTREHSLKTCVAVGARTRNLADLISDSPCILLVLRHSSYPGAKTLSRMFWTTQRSRTIQNENTQPFLRIPESRRSMRTSRAAARIDSLFLLSKAACQLHSLCINARCFNIRSCMPQNTIFLIIMSPNGDGTFPGHRHIKDYGSVYSMREVAEIVAPVMTWQSTGGSSCSSSSVTGNISRQKNLTIWIGLQSPLNKASRISLLRKALSGSAWITPC